MPLQKTRMMLRGFVTRLSLLLTCLLLITAGVRSSEVNEVEWEDGGGGGGDAAGGGEGLIRVTEDMMEGEGDVVVVRNTAEAVVLDCPYHLDEKDLNGFHISWYHPASAASPVYQWFPDKKPSAQWILQDRVDLTYEASTEALHRYRALRILKPTTDLAGRYVCRVSSFTADISSNKDLIVFSEPSGLDVWVEAREAGQVAVTCRVKEVYPQPVLNLYQISSSADSEMVTGGRPITSFSRGTYNMEVEKMVEEATLAERTEYECHMTIPNTKIRLVTATNYHPRVTVTTGAVTADSSVMQASVVLLALLFLLLSLLFY